MYGKSGDNTGFRALTVTAAIARTADRILTAVLMVILILMLLYSGYALWDTWRIYNGASVDKSLLQYKPQLNADNRATFAELMAINPDMRAWLTVNDTNIDYPVVQGEDNTHYLNADVYDNFSLSGSIFLDYRNSGDFSDSYNLLYGHHMEGRKMFGEIKEFTDAEYFKSHKTAVLFTPDVTYKVTIFACLETDAYDSQVFEPGTVSQNGISSLLERLQRKSTQYRDIGVNDGDKILAMSTCSSASTTDRTVVFGRMSAMGTAKDAALSTTSTGGES